jgi:MarR family transcriptional regulator, organic hydroperoxide resistance regulator
VRDPEGIAEMNRLLGQVCRLHFEQANAMLSDVGVYRGQPPLLHLLWERDGLSQTALADELGITAATVSKMVQRMERVGLVERRDDPEDSRISRVYLTSRGWEIRKRVEEIWHELASAMLSGLSDQERAELRRLLEQLRGNLEILTQNPAHRLRG